LATAVENRFQLEDASPLQENRIDKEVLLYHQDYYGKGEVLQKQVVLFIWKLLPSAAVIQINDDDVFQRFYRIWKDVMTAPTDRWGLGNRY